mmetsp:Transcript_10092/g.36862  ORF Transcript_10092/g.36862 Transcript_10092/m.36862 type:complete len:140 (+) Transcript_10092:1435-1854(+)
MLPAKLCRWETSHNEFFKLMDTVDAMVLRTAVYFSGNHEEDRAIRYQVLRYGILSVALFFKDARNIDANTAKERIDWEVDNLDDLVEDGLLTEHEKALLSTEYVCLSTLLIRRLYDPVRFHAGLRLQRDLKWFGCGSRR